MSLKIRPFPLHNPSRAVSRLFLAPTGQVLLILIFSGLDFGDIFVYSSYHFSILQSKNGNCDIKIGKEIWVLRRIPSLPGNEEENWMWIRCTVVESQGQRSGCPRLWVCAQTWFFVEIWYRSSGHSCNGHSVGDSFLGENFNSALTLSTMQKRSRVPTMQQDSDVEQSPDKHKELVGV